MPGADRGRLRGGWFLLPEPGVYGLYVLSRITLLVSSFISIICSASVALNLWAQIQHVLAWEGRLPLPVFPRELLTSLVTALTVKGHWPWLLLALITTCSLPCTVLLYRISRGGSLSEQDTDNMGFCGRTVQKLWRQQLRYLVAWTDSHYFNSSTFFSTAPCHLYIFLTLVNGRSPFLFLPISVIQES